MEIEALTNVLKKATKAEIPNLIQNWTFAGRDIYDSIDSSSSKLVIINTIVKQCQKKTVSSKNIGQLDLLYIKGHSKRKLWTVFELQEKNAQKKNITLPSDFQKKFKNNMNNYFRTDINVCKHNDALWIRVYIYGNDITTFYQQNVAYIVYYPGSSHIMLTQIKDLSKKYILQAFLGTVGYMTASQMDLKGHCVVSLAQLACNRTGQGMLKEFLPSKSDGVGGVFSRKRKELEDDDLGITDENKQQKRRRLQKLEDVYGTGKQPTLEKIEYNMRTVFQGKFVPSMSGQPFHCKVKFQGTNVLEGIRNMGLTGLAKIPMPEHLVSAPLKGRNSFNIKLKSRR